MVACACGITYPCASHNAKIKHEESDRHKNALKRNRFINGKKYNTAELRLLCSANKIPYYNTLKVTIMIDKLLELENIIIPQL